MKIVCRVDAIREIAVKRCLYTCCIILDPCVRNTKSSLSLLPQPPFTSPSIRSFLPVTHQSQLLRARISSSVRRCHPKPALFMIHLSTLAASSTSRCSSGKCWPPVCRLSPALWHARSQVGFFFSPYLHACTAKPNSSPTPPLSH